MPLPQLRPRPGSRPRPFLTRRARSTVRRVLAALLAAFAVGGATYAALARPPADGVRVVVAAREVPVGAVLATGDLTVRRLPPDAVPSGGLTDPGDAVGRPAAAVLAEGEVLTAHDVRTGSVLHGQPAGTVAVWLPVPDASVAAAVSAGDRVDVHSPVDGHRVVGDVLVLAVLPGSGSTGLIGTAGPRGEGGGAWVALSAEQATDLAAARGADPAGGALMLALHPAPDG